MKTAGLLIACGLGSAALDLLTSEDEVWRLVLLAVGRSADEWLSKIHEARANMIGNAVAERFS